MPLTHDFKETIRARVQRDPDFRQALLREAVECVINGDLATGKAVLRDYVNATAGFSDLEKRTQIPAKSLMRMLGPRGSPSGPQHAHQALGGYLRALFEVRESGRRVHVVSKDGLASGKVAVDDALDGLAQ